VNQAGDFEVIGVSSLWAFSKRRSYRTAVSTALESLTRFLQENGLLTRVLLGDNERVSPGFSILRSDFTDEGFEFYSKVEQPWLAAIDRGGSPESTATLERKLRDFRFSRVDGTRRTR
jgi:hypothetical protein